MTAPTVELPPEVRGYIARLQERVRDLEGKLYSLRAFMRTGVDTCDKALSGVDEAAPDGVHSIEDPRRIDHPAIDEDGPWCEWLVACSCGWSEGGYERYEHAELIGRMHAGYYSAADFT